MAKIQIVLADDHPVVRSGIRNLLESQHDIAVVGETSNGTDVLDLIRELEPDIVILDMQMPGLTGVEVARQLKAARSSVRVLALSAHDDIQYIRNLLANGASGYLMKEEAADTIVEAVRGIARGENGWLSRRVAAQMSDWTMNDTPGKHRLTEREMDVLALIVEGLSNQEIGRRLSISEKTVEKHTGSIFSKLNVTSRVEAAVLAVQEGLI